MPFQKGHRLSVGHSGPGPRREKNMTLELVDQLNSVDKDTGRTQIHHIIEKLIHRARGLTLEWVEKEVQQKDGTTIKKKVKRYVETNDGDNVAAMALWERYEGKPPQAEAPDNKIQIHVIEHVMVVPGSKTNGDGGESTPIMITEDKK